MKSPGLSILKNPLLIWEYVLDYLGRYTHRVAISNNRLIEIEENNVTFTYKDRKDEGKIKPATIRADEFIRRFLLHVLPYNFVRIRYFGFLANRYRKENLALCRKHLGAPPPSCQPTPKPIEQLMIELYRYPLYPLKTLWPPIFTFIFTKYAFSSFY